MKLLVNGVAHTIDVDTLTDVVRYFNLEEHLVVTEVNGVIIDREQWDSTNVEPEMKIELVHFVGGG
ncbi:sulfur carrier protein ThiS [Bacillus solitudinis]|uniref:sulfur carrier protein ThiS n=1 Tax=Bacillus solitudinis TaxID=2014074 RepID=UPI000C247525|nr:sulfur carrier protein ThiS [Bacillus solitudinis]